MANVSTCAGPEELSVLMDLLSHDILNKNQATLSYLELIHSQPHDERRTKDFAEMAASQVRASSMLLDCIKRFTSSTKRGAMPTSLADLAEVFASVADDLSDMFPFKRIKVDSSGLAAGASVKGAQCVHDLFRNLLVNMVQLSPQDDVTIEVTGRKEVRGGTPRWNITVTAKAAVMPQGVDDSVFARLAAIDVSKISRVSGAVFASSITRALGGSFGSRVIDPEKNLGCVFEVSLKGAGAS